MDKGRSHASVAGGKLMELRLMVSAGMEQGRSHTVVAGGKLMELRLMVNSVDGQCGDGAGKEPCHGS